MRVKKSSDWDKHTGLSPGPSAGTGGTSHGQHPHLHTHLGSGEGWASGSSPPGGAGLSQSHSLCRGTGQQGRRAKRVPHPGEELRTITSLLEWRRGWELPLQVACRTLALRSQAKASGPDSPTLPPNSPPSPRPTACPAEGSTLAWLIALSSAICPGFNS